jgi:asparagine synthase (glutamine-hydrolysing)
MCGIGGGILPKGIEAERQATLLNEAMGHRGPDDSGCQVVEIDEGASALASTRLSIIDLSAAGHMPMQDPETGNWIVHNGEVYNFLDLRAELDAAGHQFRSRTDTEVILKAYAEWGVACLQRFRGMFAFAIWDHAMRELFLARDRVGLKPLYYYQDNDIFLFASEVRALLATGVVERKLDPTALECFLWNGFEIAPQTMVRGVRSLLPGRWMRIGEDGKLKETKSYWSLPTDAAGTAMAEGLRDRARARLEEAVKLRLISDVPLGAFLSGGLDSTAIVALMGRGGSDVRTCSITFDEPEFDESAYSRWAAEKYRTQHTEIRLRAEDFASWLPEALAAMDQPTFDGINTYCVARAVREHGLTVALSGLGSDELFGGYPFFKTIPWLRGLAVGGRLLPERWVRGLGARLERSLAPVAGPWKTLELAVEPPAPALGVLAGYQVSQMLFPAWAREQLLETSSAGATHGLLYGLPPEFAFGLLAELDSGDMMDQISRSTLRVFLAERALRDTDSMSMGVSLEVRAPFTDHLFIEDMLSFAGRVRTRGAPDKPFLRELVLPFVGEDYPVRRKQGFIFPFEKWLRTPQIQGLVEQALREQDLVQSAGLQGPVVRRLVEAFHRPGSSVPWSRLWALYVLVDWCHTNGVTA